MTIDVNITGKSCSTCKNNKGGICRSCADLPREPIKVCKQAYCDAWEVDPERFKSSRAEMMYIDRREFKKR